jgi:hypothetical protein
MSQIVDDPLVRLLDGLSNFGLGESASAVSNMTALTEQTLDTLKQYYSSERRSSEEHYFELYSFRAISSLLDALSPLDRAQFVAWAVTCSSTTQRLTGASAQMLVHIEQLRSYAEIMNQRLRDCGEECADLW